MPNVDPGLFDTVVKLVNVGFAGVGVVIFLLLFILLLRDAPVNPANAKLRNRMLTWGVSFAAFCGVLSVVAPLVQARADAAKGPGSQKLVLAFSPRFDTQKLPPPVITLPDGVQVKPGQQFATASGMIQVSVDDALQQVESLRNTAQSLTASVESYRKQRDDLVAALPPAANTGNSASVVASSSAQSAASEAKVLKSIESGNFGAAAQASRTIQLPAVNSGRIVNEMRIRRLENR